MTRNIFGFSDHQEEVLFIIPKVSASLSLVGSSVYIILFYLMPPADRYKVYYHILFFMAFTDLLGSFGYLLGSLPLENEQFCTVQGWLIQFNLAVPLWNTCLSTHFLLTVFLRWPEWRARGMLYIYHICVWAITVIFSIIPFIVSAYGPAGNWCWIKVTRQELRLVLFYLPLWLLMLYNFIIVVLVVVRMKKQRARLTDELTYALGKKGFEEEKEKEKKKSFWNKMFNTKDSNNEKEIEMTEPNTQRAKLNYYNFYTDDPDIASSNLHPEDDVLATQEADAASVQFVAYVGAFFVTWLAGSVNRIQNWIRPGEPIFYLLLAHSLFVPLQGFLNVLVFVIPRISIKNWTLNINSPPTPNNIVNETTTRTSTSPEELGPSPSLNLDMPSQLLKFNLLQSFFKGEEDAGKKEK